MSFADQNPYQSPLMVETAATARESERVSFIRRTYAHLGGAILAFVALEVLMFTLIPEETLVSIAISMVGGYMWLLVLGGFMGVSWLARSWAESSTSQAMQYAGLGLYVVGQVVLFLPLMTMAQYFVGGSVLPSAALITLVVFGGLTAVVLLSKADFSFMRYYLWLGGLLAMGLIVCALLFNFNIGLWFSFAMVALAAGYILYDTSNVLHHYRTDQHVAASLALFASVALLFWYVLRIMIAISGRD